MLFAVTQSGYDAMERGGAVAGGALDVKPNRDTTVYLKPGVCFIGDCKKTTDSCVLHFYVSSPSGSNPEVME